MSEATEVVEEIFSDLHVVKLLKHWAELEPSRCELMTEIDNHISFCLTRTEDIHYYIGFYENKQFPGTNQDKIIGVLLTAVQQRQWDAELRSYKDIKTAVIYINEPWLDPSTDEVLAIAFLDAYLKALENSKKDDNNRSSTSEPSSAVVDDTSKALVDNP